jgi:hypothetical protein
MAIIAIYGFSSAVALRLNKGAKVSLRQNSLYDALGVLHGYTKSASVRHHVTITLTLTFEDLMAQPRRWDFPGTCRTLAGEPLKS